MSKRAEELAWSLCEQYDPPYLRKEFAIKEATKLIDAELRKERERAAERIRSKDRLHIGSSGLISIDDACAAILDVQLNAGRDLSLKQSFKLGEIYHDLEDKV